MVNRLICLTEQIRCPSSLIRLLVFPFDFSVFLCLRFCFSFCAFLFKFCFACKCLNCLHERHDKVEQQQQWGVTKRVRSLHKHHAHVDADTHTHTGALTAHRHSHTYTYNALICKYLSANFWQEERSLWRGIFIAPAWVLLVWFFLCSSCFLHFRLALETVITNS